LKPVIVVAPSMTPVIVAASSVRRTIHDLTPHTYLSVYVHL